MSSEERTANSEQRIANKVRVYCLLLAACCPLVFVGCGIGRGLFGAGKILRPAQAKELPYLIQQGDQLDITVLGYTDLNRKVLIRDDGFFAFPGLGDILAEQRSLKEIQEEIQRRIHSQYAETVTGAPTDSYTALPAEQAAEQAYRLQAGDQVHISVWKHDELTKEAMVREDGTISFPLIGNVRARGDSLRQLEEEIAAQLGRDYVVNPQVSARLVGVPFTVLGPIAKPGSYVTDSTVDLLAALSMAGGLTQQGVTQVDILRRLGSQKFVIRVDLNLVLQGKHPNLTVLPHDTISVKPATGFQVTVLLFGAKYTVIGEVGRPGSYGLEGQTDLLTAVSEAGGISKFGSSRVEIVRERGGRRWVIRADLNRILQGADPNVAIQPHDTLYVRRRFI